ncbi:MAG TPA: hypothetical protein VGM19_12290 [Armatimonadota bacterium]|jgi:hypothetical protein
MSSDQLQNYVREEDPRGLSLLVDPFRFINGAPGLVAGLGVVALTVAIGLTGVSYDGVIDLHVPPTPLPGWFLAAMPVLDWLLVAILFCVAGRLLSRSRQRVLDYFAMTALGRAPLAVAGVLLLPPLLGKILAQVNERIMANPAAIGQSLMNLPGLPWLIFGGMVIVLLMIWLGFLNYYALKEASGLKGPIAVVTFFVVALLAELFSKVAIYALGTLVIHGTPL